MEHINRRNKQSKKLSKPTTRPFNTAVYLLRALQVGLSIQDLSLIEFGEVVDLIIESGNDRAKYEEEATEESIRRLLG